MPLFQLLNFFPPWAGRTRCICSQDTLFYQLAVSGHNAVQKVGVYVCVALLVYAGSEHAPVHTVPRCSLAGPVNHLPVTGGGNTTAGLAVQRVASGPLLSEVFGLLPREMRVLFFFFFQCRTGKVFLFLYPERSRATMLLLLTHTYVCIQAFLDISGISQLVCMYSCRSLHLLVCVFVLLHVFQCRCAASPLLSFRYLVCVFERLFHLSSCTNVVARATDQRQNPQGQRGPSVSSRCFPSLLVTQLKLSLFNQVRLMAPSPVSDAPGSLFFFFCVRNMGQNAKRQGYRVPLWHSHCAPLWISGQKEKNPFYSNWVWMKHSRLPIVYSTVLHSGQWLNKPRDRAEKRKTGGGWS